MVGSLKTEREVCRIVVFGSFVNSDNPHDMDVAVFQDSDEKYLPLAMKYRRKTRDNTYGYPALESWRAWRDVHG